jgi:hypothetical protein
VIQARAPAIYERLRVAGILLDRAMRRRVALPRRGPLGRRLVGEPSIELLDRLAEPREMRLAAAWCRRSIASFSR